MEIENRVKINESEANVISYDSYRKQLLKSDGKFVFQLPIYCIVIIKGGIGQLQHHPTFFLLLKKYTK